MIFVLLLVAAPPDRVEGVLLAQLLHGSHGVDLGFDDYGQLAWPGQELAEEGRVEDHTFVGPRRPLSLPLRRLLARRDDLAGLPWRSDREAHLSRDAEEALRKVAQRHGAATRGGYGTSLVAPDLERQTEDLIQTLIRSVEAPYHLPGPLEQVLTVHPAAVRQTFARQLGSIPGPEARRVLARRAVFDLSPAVRATAAAALAEAETRDARPVLLAALRHPWPPAADHAAWALVRTRDVGALPELRKLVGLPPPDEPYRDGERWLRRDVARIDHLRNCLLCHPATVEDPARTHLVGLAMRPGRRFTPEKDESPPHVYAHVAFLRPDVSATYRRPVDRENGWPAEGRYDFVAYTRPLSDAERREHLVNRADPPATYPQGEAVRWAVRELEGRE